MKAFRARDSRAALLQALAGRQASTAPGVRTYVSIRQHASAYVSMRQHTSAYVRLLGGEPRLHLACGGRLAQEASTEEGAAREVWCGRIRLVL